MAGKKLTKADIIDSINLATGTNRKDIHAVIDLLIEEIKTALTDGRIVELRGFGTFEIRVRKGRKKARNPKTGEPVSVNAHGVAAFRPGKELKQEVWNITDLANGPEEGGAEA